VCSSDLSSAIRGLCFCGHMVSPHGLMPHVHNWGTTSIEIGAGGPASFKKRDRSLFLQSLDKVIRAIRDGK